MKFKRAIACLCAAGLLMGGAQAVQFPDAETHWAAQALYRAAEQGILTGEPDGRIMPDAPVTGAEAAVMLCRVLDARAPGTYPGSEGKWFEDAAGRAAALGILPDGLNLAQPLTRGDAFCALAGAFQLTAAQPANTVLDKFSDMAQARPAVRRAAAALVARGVLYGTGNGLSADETLTRAEFVTILDRLLFDAPRESAVTIKQALEEGDPDQAGDLLLSPAAQAVELADMTLQGSLIVRGHLMEQVTFERVQGNMLTLAATNTDIFLSDESESSFDTIRVGDGSGFVSLSGNVASTIEVTGAKRQVSLAGMQLDVLAVSGSGSTITVDADTHIAALAVMPGADRVTIEVDGAVDAAEIYGSGCSLAGAGTAGSVLTRGKNCAVSLQAQTLDQQQDLGLEGVTLALDTPEVQAGGQLAATLRASGGEGLKNCRVVWTVDGKQAQAVEAAPMGDGAALSYTQPLTFAFDMPLKHTVAATVTYYNPLTGEKEQLYASGEVTVRNYGMEHYAEEVLKKISPVYNGPSEDYTEQEKTIFVNAKGYISTTGYLLWVSLSKQKVNVFEWKQGAWALTHTFDCATGLPRSPTPKGVTYVTAKQTAWLHSTYTCRPIVRFYPNTGYAFHSRLYMPNGSGQLVDGTMGKPASHGCVRMMDEGIYWIYDNVPLKSTVVIY